MHGRKYEKITLKFLSNALVKMCLPYLKRTTEKTPKRTISQKMHVGWKNRLITENALATHIKLSHI